MGGKSKAPPPPDYQPVAQSSMEAAKMQQKTSADQLAWAKEQYADQAPRTNAYMDTMTRASDAQAANAQTDRSRYASQYQPLEDRAVDRATTYDTMPRSQQQAASAMADTAAQFEGARRASTAGLEAYGIDPSSTRYAALDLGTRISGAAAMAGTATASRLNTIGTGLAMEGNAVNIGKGYPGQVTQSYAGATQAGGAGVSAGLNTSSTFGNLMGTSVQYAGLANQSTQGAMGAMRAGGEANNAAAGINNANSAATGQGIGTAVGAVASVASIAVMI